MLFMMDSSDSSSDEENKENLKLQRKIMRQNSDIFNLPENKFIEYFRLSKAAFKFVLDEIEPQMKSGVRKTFISNDLKLATILRFLAQGSYQLSVGNDFCLGLSQPAVYFILEETLEARQEIIVLDFFLVQQLITQIVYCLLFSYF